MGDRLSVGCSTLTVRGLLVEREVERDGGLLGQLVTRITLQAPGPLPSGLVIAWDSLAAAWSRVPAGQRERPGAWLAIELTRLHSEAEAVRWTVHHPRVLERLLDLLERRIRLTVEQGCVRLWCAGAGRQEADRLAEDAVGLARALVDGFTAPLQSFAEARDLHVRLLQRSVVLSGTVRGRPLRLRVGTRLELRVGVTGLPAWFSAERGEGGVDHGDPVLGSVLRITGSDVGAVAELVARDGVRERLLEVVHGLLDARVTDEQVAVTSEVLPLAELAELVDRVVGLAVALSGG